MAKVLYTATAEVSGGREHGHATTTDGGLTLELRTPEALGGPGGGTNPEELFAVGYAACFEGALAVVARRAKLEGADAIVRSSVSMSPSGTGGFVLGVGLDVTLPSIEDPAAAVDLVAKAHEVCPYSNATRGNIDVTLTANGQPVG